LTNFAGFSPARTLPRLRHLAELCGGRPPAENPTSSRASSQKRAGLGVWAATRSTADRREIVKWKTAEVLELDQVERFAGPLAALVREWSGGVWVAGSFVAVPPQGASAPGPYAAAAVAGAVAAALGLPFRDCLIRTDSKRRHGPWASREQAPYLVTVAAEGPLALVVDDLITSGTTLRLSLAALRGVGVAAFGFGFSGC